MKTYHFLLKLFFIMIFMSSIGYSYTVKLAVFKNYDGLKHLIGTLSNKEDRKEIVIHQEKGFYNAFSKSFKSKHEARSALVRYKKVFYDAYIIQEKGVQLTSVMTEKKAKVFVENDMLEKYLLREIKTKEPTYKLMYLDDVFSRNKHVVSTEKSSLSWKEQLKLHKGTFYVKYMLGSQELKHKLMKFIFNNGKLIYGNLLDKDTIPAQALYEFNKKNMDVYSEDKKFSMKIYLEKINSTHLLVSMYTHNKKINEAKYYFNRSDALMEKN